MHGLHGTQGTIGRGERRKKLKRNPRRHFAFRLAMALGFYDVDAMLDGAAPKMLAEWEAFYWLEPFGQEWLRTSLNTARTLNTLHAIAASWGDGKLDESQLIDDDAFVPGKASEKQGKDVAAQCEAAENLEGFGF